MMANESITLFSPRFRLILLTISLGLVFLDLPRGFFLLEDLSFSFICFFLDLFRSFFLLQEFCVVTEKQKRGM